MKHQRLTSSLALTACLAVVCLAPATWADIITTNPGLPPFTGYYQGQGTFAVYSGPGLVVTLTDLRLTPLTFNYRTPSGTDEIESYLSLFDGIGSVNGSPLMPAGGSGQFLSLAHNKIGNVTGTFQTEMLSMSVFLGTSSGQFMLRESPTLASLGQTTITPVGGGNFQINSFFDIFTELSVDSGQTWIPSSTGPGHVVLVPEPGTVMLMALGLGGLIILRRRAKA